MKKRFFIILMLIVCYVESFAFAEKNNYGSYPDGVETYIVSEERENNYKLIAHSAIQNASEEMRTCQLTLEQRAEETQLLTAEERAYSVLWGLPKIDDISQEEALFTAYAVLQDKFLLSDSELTFLFPIFTFEVTNPDATLWCIKFLHTDAEQSVIYIVKLYSGSGCLAETRVENSVG